MNQDNKKNAKIICIIPAAGESSRFKKGNKLFSNIAESEKVLSRTIKNFNNLKLIDEIFVGLNPNNNKSISNQFLDFKNVTTYNGGDSRQETVFNGLNHIKKLNIDDIEDLWIIIHDAARPTIFSYDILNFIENTLKLNKPCIMAIPITDTIKKVDKNNNIISTIPRNKMWLAQTPQMFRFGILFDSLNNCISNKIHVTDESQALEMLNHECTVVKGKPYNIKITEDIDLTHAKCLANIDKHIIKEEESND